LGAIVLDRCEITEQRERLLPDLSADIAGPYGSDADAPKAAPHGQSPLN
jgi:hypothetical protein